MTGNGGDRFGAPTDAVAGDGEATEGEGEGEVVREVVEPDVIRRDGNLLYVLNQYRGLSIVDLDAESLLAQVPTLGYPRDLYLAGDRAYVLVGYAHNVYIEAGVVQTDIASRIYVLDVSQPATAEIIASFDLAGDFVDSRLVGDVLYAVSAEFEWYYYEGGVVDGGGGGVVNPDGSVSSGGADGVAKQQTSDSWVTSVNIADPENIAVVDTMSFAGYGNIIQATNQAIFVAASDWYTDQSTITYIDISDAGGSIAVRGSVDVDGHIADRFKMDAYNGVLRVVSSTGWPDRNVYVTTVDLSDPDALAVLGRTGIEGAEDETLFATRFDGPRGYVVTYFQVDPLFVLDLSDPANPTVAGELVVPGWSTHIEPQGNLLVALGVDDTAGRRVSVSLFDVTNPAAPALLDRTSFGEDWSWSTAYDDVKAFTVLDDVLIVPFSGYDYNSGLSYERLQFVSYTPTSVEARGAVELNGQILRSFAYGTHYYGVSTEQLAVIDASDLDAPVVTNTVTLAEYVADFQELSSGVGAEVITRWDTGSTLVRTTDAAGAALGAVEVPMANLSDSHVYGTRLVLIATGWDDRSYYQVAVVDCTDAAAPEVETLLRVAVDPYWGWYCWDCYYGVPEMDRPMPATDAAAGSAEKMFAPWYIWQSVEGVSFVTGDLLVLRCRAADYDVTVGEKTPEQGLAVVDLAEGAWTQTIGLGFDEVVSVDAVGETLYVGTRESAGKDEDGLPLVANYVAELDPATVALGPSANVPGTFVQYDPDTGVLVVEDVQYDVVGPIIPMLDIWWGYRGVTRALTSLDWDGGDTATAVDTVDLPPYPQEVLGRGGRVYFAYYEEGYHARSVAVGAAGQLSAGETADLGEVYADLLDARGDTAYFSVGGRAIATYDFSGTPALVGVTEVMETPLRLRFGEATAYAPLGYAGLARLPL